MCSLLKVYFPAAGNLHFFSFFSGYFTAAGNLQRFCFGNGFLTKRFCSACNHFEFIRIEFVLHLVLHFRLLLSVILLYWEMKDLHDRLSNAQCLMQESAAR